MALATSSATALRLALVGQWAALLAWAVGAAFIPSLALALGAWSGSSKAFEVLYLVLWYLGPMNRVPVLDYLGATGDNLLEYVKVTQDQGRLRITLDTGSVKSFTSTRQPLASTGNLD